MERLPEDLLLSVLARLSPAQLARSAKGVCRLWRDAGRALNYLNLARIDAEGGYSHVKGVLPACAVARGVHPLILREVCGGSLDTYVGWKLWWYGRKDVGGEKDEEDEEEGNAVATARRHRLLFGQWGAVVGVAPGEASRGEVRFPPQGVVYSCGTLEHAYEPCASPSGRHLAFTSTVWRHDGSGTSRPRGCIVVADCETGAPLFRVEVDASIPGNLDWSSDGCFLTFVALEKPETKPALRPRFVLDVAAALGRGGGGPASRAPRVARVCSSELSAAAWTSASSSRLILHNLAHRFYYFDPCSPDADWVECARMPPSARPAAPAPAPPPPPPTGVIDLTNMTEFGTPPASLMPPQPVEHLPDFTARAPGGGGGGGATAGAGAGASPALLPIYVSDIESEFIGVGLVFDPAARAERLWLLFAEEAAALAEQPRRSRKRRMIAHGPEASGSPSGGGEGGGTEEEEVEVAGVGGGQVEGQEAEGEQERDPTSVRAHELFIVDEARPRAALDALLRRRDPGRRPLPSTGEGTAAGASRPGCPCAPPRRPPLRCPLSTRH
jgi:hypothetical protein